MIPLTLFDPTNHKITRKRQKNTSKHLRTPQTMPSNNTGRRGAGRQQRGAGGGAPIRAIPVSIQDYEEDAIVVVAQAINDSEVAGNLHNTIGQLRARIKVLEKKIKDNNKDKSLTDGLMSKIASLEKKIAKQEKRSSTDTSGLDWQQITKRQIPTKYHKAFGAMFLDDIAKGIGFAGEEAILGCLECLSKEGLLTLEDDKWKRTNTRAVSKETIQEGVKLGWLESHNIIGGEKRQLDWTYMWNDEEKSKDITVRRFFTIKDWEAERTRCEKIDEEQDALIKKLNKINNELKAKTIADLNADIVRENDRLGKQNDKLVAEVKKNLERNQDLKGFRSICDSLSLPELTHDCLLKYLTQEWDSADDEIAKLKEENKQLKKQIADDDILFQDCNQ